MMISLSEYAKRHKKDESVLRRKAQNGGFKTAQKIGRNWVIDENEPYEDRRFKASSDYVEREILNKTGTKAIGHYYINIHSKIEFYDINGQPIDLKKLSVDEDNYLDNLIDSFEEGRNTLIDGYEMCQNNIFVLKRKIEKVEFFDE